MYLMSRYGIERVDQLFWDIQMIIVRSLVAVKEVMINDKHCFELYGYDLIFDENLRPYLIEVNASPSLSANTREDYLLKTEMLHGMLDVVDMDQVLSGDEEHVSGWDLVYDNGFVEVDPTLCSYTTFLGAAIPEPTVEVLEQITRGGTSSKTNEGHPSGAVEGKGKRGDAGGGDKEKEHSGTSRRPSTGGAGRRRR